MHLKYFGHNIKVKPYFNVCVTVDVQAIFRPKSLGKIIIWP